MKGLVGTVTCRLEKLGEYDIVNVMMTNDVGGTGDMPPGVYRVRVTKVVGRGRLVGELLEPAAIEASRRAGTTGIDPETYRQYEKVNPTLYKKSVKARREWRPEVVYFSQYDFVPDNKEK